MKRVSFEVAKALKEAGYPQKGISYYWYSKEDTECYSESDLDEIGYVFSPTYLEVWLWLWREKKIPIDLCSVDNERWAYFEQGINISRDGYIYRDPEEAIIAAIDYLVANKLLK